ncbi:RecQ family ATP-dependent DNA helicase [Pseudoalteromonas sp. McH1-7]|uniref:RecQ family ATP-dependent DNA helicase n=1 Tax=Pseudoalteromonas sp. McH1-7 TaxID=2745574 RepID=UPI00158FA3DF|nr:RecQ family ATP-dependent DNA helicase [Pseudoalteromonas sp. McH1-7]NUZ10272.1 RecQ family ATP-dependent DNA helicase [Pseudoalteromonas sp. McH1-7]
MNQKQIFTTLQQTFGHSTLRHGQAEVIDLILKEQSTIAIFATGAGKSLCYQLPAVLKSGMCVVVSPLLALMHEQRDYLLKIGVKSACLDSTQTRAETTQVENEIISNTLKVLFISVERLNSQKARLLLSRAHISFLVIDEAHCISEWGHNFRPDYLKIAKYREELGIKQVLLLTATATNKVANDMACKFNIQQQSIVRTGFYRKNLHLSAVYIREKQKDEYLLAFLKRAKGAGIVYVTQQKQAEEVAKMIVACGFKAAAFHASLKAEDKAQIQANFLTEPDLIVVATIAFGMGVDKPDVRWVLHYDMPKSIEGYSQEVGRAGRDSKPAYCVALINNEKISTLENFVHASALEYASLKHLFTELFSAPDQDYHLNEYDLANKTNINQLVLKTLLVQLELQGLLQINYSYFAELHIAFTQTKEKLLAHFSEQRQVFLDKLLSCFEFKKKWGVLSLAALENNGISLSKAQDAIDYLSNRQLIEVKTSKYTSVYSKTSESIDIDKLTDEFYQQAQIKAQGEQARLKHLLQFFQLTTCYHYALASYFGDSMAPKHCGHCSACEGKAMLMQVEEEPPIDIELIRETLRNASQFATQNSVDFSTHLKTLFLLGLSCPYFTRFKFRQLTGFGILKGVKYDKVAAIITERKL